MSSLVPDTTILGLLAVRPQHGYELLEQFQNPARLGRIWKLSSSQLYAVLKRLEGQGLTQRHEVQPPGAPLRVEYALTEWGQVALDAWLNDIEPLPSIRSVRVEFLSRLYIAEQLGLPTHSILERQREMCLQHRAELDLQRAFPKRLGTFGLLALDLSIAQLDAVIRWLDTCREALSA
jgi:PadR family transcriptional regulator AphA